MLRGFCFGKLGQLEFVTGAVFSWGSVRMVFLMCSNVGLGCMVVVMSEVFVENARVGIL